MSARARDALHSSTVEESKRHELHLLWRLNFCKIGCDLRCSSGWVRMRNERAEEIWKAKDDMGRPEVVTLRCEIASQRSELYRATFIFHTRSSHLCISLASSCPLTNDLHSFIHISLAEISVLCFCRWNMLNVRKSRTLFMWASKRLIKLFYFSSSLLMPFTFHFSLIVSSRTIRWSATQQWQNVLRPEGGIEIINNNIH